MANQQLTGMAAQAAAAYFGGGMVGTAGYSGMAGGGGGTQGGNGGGNGMNGGIGGGAGAGGLFGGALDFSQRSSVDSTTTGGGGFDGSGWAVNIGQGSQSSTSSPYTQDQGISRVAYAPDQFGLPNSFAMPQAATTALQGAAGVSPLWMVAGVFVVVLALKGRRK